MLSNELTPLVTSRQKLKGSFSSETIDEVAEIDYDVTTISNEIRYISKSSLPLIITFFLQYTLTVVSIFSVGHIGKTELAAVSLAIMTFNVTVSIFNGMATCLDTFCAQAYGAKQYNLVGVYFQRCTAMIFVCAIPVLLLWYNSGAILKQIVPEKDLVYLAQTYLRYISLGAPGYILFETGKRFLQAQNIFVAGQYSLFIVAPINVVLNYVLVWNSRFGLGFIGAPLSTAISYWLMAIILLCYAVFIDGSQCWYGLRLKDSFNIKEWKPMMGLALSGTAMLLSEFIAFEVLTLAASRFGTSVLAAQSIVSTMATLVFQIPFGVSVSVSTRMANYIGAEEMKNARITNSTAYFLSAMLGILNCSVLVIFRAKIASLFTDDSQVIAIAVTIITILGINQLYDCPNVILAGCLRGQGRQHIGRNLNLIAYYIIAVPLALTLSFVLKKGLVGLWAGLGVGVFSLAVGECYYLMQADWEQIDQDAKARNSVQDDH